MTHDRGDTEATERPCTVCGRALTAVEPYTCTGCVETVKRTIGDIVTAAGLLPGEMVDGNRAASLEPVVGGSGDTSVPGGDALVLAGPGNTAAADADASDADAESVDAVLSHWEDYWRPRLGEDAALEAASAVRSARWLVGHMAACARVPPTRSVALSGPGGAVDLEATGSGHAFAAMAQHLRQLRGRLEAVTGSGYRTAYAGAGCLRCGEPELVWGQADPDPCDCEATRPEYPVIPPFPKAAADPAGLAAERASWAVERAAAVEAWRRDLVAWEATHAAHDQGGGWVGGHDQGGRGDTVECRNCGHRYTRTEYQLALRGRVEAERAEQGGTLTIRRDRSA